MREGRARSIQLRSTRITGMSNAVIRVDRSWIEGRARSIQLRSTRITALLMPVIKSTK